LLEFVLCKELYVIWQFLAIPGLPFACDSLNTNWNKKSNHRYGYDCFILSAQGKSRTKTAFNGVLRGGPGLRRKLRSRKLDKSGTVWSHGIFDLLNFVSLSVLRNSFFPTHPLALLELHIAHFLW
jgi:hypothetical protein